MVSATETLDRTTAEAPPRAWTPTVGGWVARLGVLIAILGLVLLVTATRPNFWQERIALAAIWAIIGLSLNIVLGYIGQVSLGHHAFVGIAAFVSAWYVTEQAGCTIERCSFGAFATGTVIAALSGAAAAAVLGLIALRIRGLYLALITLAYGFVAERSIFEIPSLTRGGAGMPATRPDGWATGEAFAYLCFIFLAGVIYIDWRFLRSKVGRAVLAIKHSEPVAASYGINVTAYKVLAFTMSGLFAGIAGSLFAFHSQNVVSNDFSFANATLWVLMVVVGGLGNRVGIVCISAFFALFPFLLELWTGFAHYIEGLGRAMGNVTIVVGALLALLTIISFPGGFGEQISPITRWISGKKFSLHPHDEHEEEQHEEKTPSGGLMAKLGLHKESDGEKETSRLEALGRAVERPVADARATEQGPAAAGSNSSVEPPDVWGALTRNKSEERT